MQVGPLWHIAVGFQLNVSQSGRPPHSTGNVQHAEEHHFNQVAADSVRKNSVPLGQLRLASSDSVAAADERRLRLHALIAPSTGTI